MFNQRNQLYGLLCLGLLVGKGTFLPEQSIAEIVTYEFSGSLFDSEGASPFTVGETYTGSISVNLNTPKSFEQQGAASYDNAIVNFDIAFSNGLRLDGAGGGLIRIQSDISGDSVIFSAITQTTQFSNTSQELDTFGMLFFSDHAAVLVSNELTDLPQSFDSFSPRLFAVGLLSGPVAFQYGNNGTLDTFSATAVPEPSSLIVCSLVTLSLSLRRKRRRCSVCEAITH